MDGAILLRLDEEKREQATGKTKTDSPLSRTYRRAICRYARRGEIRREQRLAPSETKERNRPAGRAIFKRCARRNEKGRRYGSTLSRKSCRHDMAGQRTIDALD